ncbi:Zinc finger, RING-type [Gossypium australe]|uniref:Zinc finger, RING-type n=1 Tax=Gossypium australe TaxID=47621 RepID=A0A5B6V492_9ROSI|nr:Zinc finger, RING-type [Gossypium australe]
MFESENEQGWNHMHLDQPYANLVSASTIEHGSFFYLVENMFFNIAYIFIDAMHISSHWNLVPRSIGYATSSHNVKALYYQLDVSSPFHNLILHPSAFGVFGATLENYIHYAFSSNYDTQSIHRIGGEKDLTSEKALDSLLSMKGYVGAGCSSNLPLSSNLCQEKPNINPQHMH